MDDVSLTVGGLRYSGWTEVEIVAGLDAVVPAFRIGVTERWPGHPERWTIDAGSAAVVAIGGVPLITGYVDRLEAELDGDAHRVTVSGRARTADLVDCSAVNAPGSWAGRPLEAIAAELAAPFGIAVTAEASTTPVFAKFAIQQGESAWDAIERMLRMRGLLGMTDPDGNLRLLTPAPGPAAVTLTEGREIVRLSASHDVADRFSRYIAKGQAAGDDYASGAAVAGPRGEALDPAVTRNRPLVILAEDQATPASLRQRAMWEATVRAGRAQEATVTIAGWRRPDGALWEAAQLVRLVAPSGWIDHTMLVVSVTLRLGADRRSTELKLGRPEAFTQLALPEDAKESNIRKVRENAKLGRAQ